MPWLTIIFVVIAGGAQAADYTVLRRTIIDDGSPQQQTEYWSRNRLVVDDSAQRMIVDFAAGTLIVADKERRTYTQLALDDVRRGLSFVSAIVEQLPSATRELLGLGRKVTVTSTGNTTKIAGHAAKEYGVSGEGVRGWVWLAEDLDPGKLLGDEAAAWWRAGGPLHGAGVLIDLAYAIGEQKLAGMPVWAAVTAGSPDGTVSIDSQVVAVREEKPPADVGKVPEDYRRESSPLAGP
jgi:hypothetical protein